LGTVGYETKLLLARSFLDASRNAIAANKLDVTIGEIASSMKRSVDRDIKKVSDGSESQTVNPIINGLPAFIQFPRTRKSMIHLPQKRSLANC